MGRQIIRQRWENRLKDIRVNKTTDRQPEMGKQTERHMGGRDKKTDRQR